MDKNNKVDDTSSALSEKEKHIHTKEQFDAVVKYIVDSHHAIKQVKEFATNFDLTPEDLEEIDKMVGNETPIFIIVYEILHRHHKNSDRPPSLKSVAEIFTKMGLQHLADDIEKLWDQEEFCNSHKKDLNA